MGEERKVSLDYDPVQWVVQSVDVPFKLYRIENVFTERRYVTKLKNELDRLQFSHNMNDMFSLHQTENLTHLKNHAKYPMLRKFLQFLENLKDILSREMNVELDSKISVSSSKYCNEDFLLCHDDHSDDRYIAFIYYLNPEWKTDWGGSLDIFEHDSKGQPSRIAYSIYPEFNSLIFFQVGNLTYHQVAEIISDDTPRITINGWFHSKRASAVEPLPYYENAVFLTETHNKGALMYLQHFLNNNFVNKKSVSLIREVFQEKNVIMLQEFLKPRIFDRISEELNSPFVRWKQKGPVNRRRYDVVDEDTLSPLGAAFLNFFRSKYACSYLETISGQDLFHVKNDNRVGLVHAEIQFWKGACYSLLNDSDAHSKEDALEMWLFFNVRKDKDGSVEVADDNSIQPGNIYYCTRCSYVPEYEIEPADNSVCWVHKNRNQSMFVTYISAKSVVRYHALRVCYKMSM